jgi:hypothetical protein
MFKAITQVKIITAANITKENILKCIGFIKIKLKIGSTLSKKDSLQLICSKKTAIRLDDCGF